MKYSVIKVEWFRLSAKTTRWREEVNILQEEIKRTQRYFLHCSKKWEDRSKESGSSLVGRGMKAYAARYVLKNLVIYYE